MAVSLVFHAAVLFLLPVLQEAQRRIPARTLTARLEALKPPVPAPPKIEPPTPAPAPVRQAPVARAAPRAPAPAPPIVSVAPATQSAEPVFAVPAQSPAPPANAAQPAPRAAAPAASGPDPGTIARFRLELMDVARRYKKYPRIAQDNNWEGRVELRVAIGEDGRISSMTVRKSAGRTVLDEEAQEMLRTAKSRVAVPPALRGAAFNMDIAVDFFLKEE